MNMGRQASPGSGKKREHILSLVSHAQLGRARRETRGSFAGPGERVSSVTFRVARGVGVMEGTGVDSLMIYGQPLCSVSILSRTNPHIYQRATNHGAPQVVPHSRAGVGGTGRGGC